MINEVVIAFAGGAIFGAGIYRGHIPGIWMIAMGFAMFVVAKLIQVANKNLPTR